VEQEPLYDQIDFERKLNFGNPRDSVVENIDLIGTSFSIYRCPSDTCPDSHSFSAYASYYPEIPALAISNYVANGTSCLPCYFGFLREQDIGYAGCPNGPTGVLFRNSDTRMKDLRDGSTYTFLVGERVCGKANQECKWEGTAYWPGSPGPVSYELSCWAGLMTAAVDVYFEDHPKCIQMINGHAYGFSSRHPGGVQLALCDGSVRWVTEGVQKETLVSLMEIQDGRVVSGF
jgi:prepilin-type processing-associated H-X9-DG protein